MPLLQINNLKTHFFSDGTVTKAVDGVSYDVEAGETVALVGESGCGKSVSSLSVMQLIPQPPGKIVDGEILYDGQNLLSLNREEMRRMRGREIAMIFQEPMTSLNPVISIETQLTEAMTLQLGITSNQARKKGIDLLERVGIPEPEVRVRQYPHEFSGGMRQRVMVAMALSCEPKLIIADEPTTALDVTNSGPDSRPVERPCRRAGTGAPDHHPQPRSCGTLCRSNQRHVCRQIYRERNLQRHICRSAPPLHARAT